jgi:UPF0271 protein
MKIDLNADLAEGCGNDDAIMRLVSSANICCGSHAGGIADMDAALNLAKKHHVCVGAHPGYPDRENFGRKPVKLNPADLARTITDQLELLEGRARLAGIPIRYLKLHGALYHEASQDEATAELVAQIARQHFLLVMGLPESTLEKAARQAAIGYIREGFADRRYLPEGGLVPRSQPDALIHDPGEAARQVRGLIDSSHVDSICVHGDSPDAVRFTSSLRTMLEAAGISIAAP